VEETMIKQQLSQYKQNVYGFIAGYIASNGEAPTLAEIGKQFGLSSSGSVHQILVELERDGLIKRSRVWRGIQIARPSTPMVGWLDR
jgi:SOS-response transcriptional repressor LexA